MRQGELKVTMLREWTYFTPEEGTQKLTPGMVLAVPEKTAKEWVDTKKAEYYKEA